MHAYLARTETFVHNQIATLSRYRPVVVAHHRRSEADFPLREGAIAQECLSAPLRMVQRAGYRTARLALPPGVAALARYLREQDARLLHYHFLTDARFLLGLQRRTGLPAVVSAYGYDVSWFPGVWGGLGKRWLRPIFDRLDCFLAMSEDMREDLLELGCAESKIQVHYYGTDTKRFRYPERTYERDAPLTIVCCGRLHPSKGQHLVLEALRRVERRGRAEFRVVLVGQGDFKGELERQVAEYGWTDRVRLAGHVPYTSDALIDHYRSADVFALPSFTLDGIKEGIPGTIVEAMACGLPVVATLHAGIPSVIDSGRDGWLVPERDIDGLASAFETLLGDPALRERLGRAAAARAGRELDLATRTRHLERIYDRFA